MSKRYIPIEQAHVNLANAIADMIEHPDCEPGAYNSLMTLVEDWENTYSDTVNPAEEARRIRKNLPKWFPRKVRGQEG